MSFIYEYGENSVMCVSGYLILILSFRLKKLNSRSSVACGGGGGDDVVNFSSIPGAQIPDNHLRLFQKQLSA